MDEPAAAAPATGWLARYQPWRRTAEIGFWVVVLGLQVLFNSLVSWIDLARAGQRLPYWQPLAWELTSVIVVGLLVPVVAAWERRFPIQRAGWRRSLAAHLAGSFVFCLLHVIGMTLLRRALYAALGEPVSPPDWLRIVGYELLKDLRSYALILAALWTYRLVLLRAQGEVRLLDEPEAPALDGPSPVVPAEAATQEMGGCRDLQDSRLRGNDGPSAAHRPERFLVRKLRREFLIAAADIEWLQAEGNYVGLHVNGHDYLLRSTLSDLLAQLDPARFVRVHRSHAVNLDRIAEIEPLDSGDARLKMKDGSMVPCSRRYRDALGGRHG